MLQLLAGTNDSVNVRAFILPVKLAKELDNSLSNSLAISGYTLETPGQGADTPPSSTKDIKMVKQIEKTVTASEAKNSFGKLVAWVREENEPVIVENRGVPVAALISYEELEEFREMKWRKKAAQALEDLKQLQKEVSSRPANRNLTEEEAWALGKRLINETLAEMEAEGKISFEH